MRVWRIEANSTYVHSQPPPALLQQTWATLPIWCLTKRSVGESKRGRDNRWNFPFWHPPRASRPPNADPPRAGNAACDELATEQCLLDRYGMSLAKCPSITRPAASGGQTCRRKETEEGRQSTTALKAGGIPCVVPIESSPRAEHPSRSGRRRVTCRLLSQGHGAQTPQARGATKAGRTWPCGCLHVQHLLPQTDGCKEAEQLHTAPRAAR